MKKLILLISGTLMTGLLTAQPLGNHLYFSGAMGLGTTSGETTVTQSNTTTDNNSVFTYNFIPAIGYTLSDNMMVGILLGIGGSNTEVPGTPTTSSSNVKFGAFGAGAFFRYYIPINERFYFYPQLVTGFINTEIETSGGGAPTLVTNESGTFGIGIIPGFAYYPSTHWGIEFTAGFLGYTTTNTNNNFSNPAFNTEVKTNNFGIQLSAVTVNVGVSYLLQLGGE